MITQREPFDVSKVGLRVYFEPGETNRCPSCGRSQFHVGRLTAECAFCYMPLEIRVGAQSGVGIIGFRSSPFAEMVRGAFVENGRSI